MTLSQQRYDDALALHRSGRLDEANAAYRALLADEPANAGVLHLLGVVEGQCGRYTQAVQLIEGLILDTIEPCVLRRDAADGAGSVVQLRWPGTR